MFFPIPNGNSSRETVITAQDVDQPKRTTADYANDLLDDIADIRHEHFTAVCDADRAAIEHQALRILCSMPIEIILDKASRARR